MGRFRQDTRHALRALAAQPRFTAVVVLTLGIGIGANSVIYSVVDGVLLHSLEYPESEELVQIWDVNRLDEEQEDRVAPADFLDWREQNQTFEGLAAYYTTGVNLWGVEEPERVTLGVASRNYFSLLGANPMLGRPFEAEEEQWGNHRVALLSHGLWQRQYGSDPGAVGEEIVLNGSTFTIVGVLPRDFRFSGARTPDEEPAVWRPLAFQEAWTERDGSRWLYVMGRLAEGVTLREARADLKTVAERLEMEYPTNANRTVRLVPLHEELVGEYRASLFLLFGAVAAVLLICCVNVSNLLLARALTRQTEFSTRLALGASRGRLVSQLLTESLVLSMLAGVVGLVGAYWGIGTVVATWGSSIPRLQEVGLDGRIVVFTIALSLLTALLFGLAPAIAGTRVPVAERLKQGGRTQSSSLRRVRLRGLFVVAEVAVVIVLLVGAGLMIRSFQHLRGTDAGFDPESVLTANVVLPRVGYEEDPPKIQLVDRLTESLSKVAGVQAVGVTSFLPLADSNASRDFYVEGRPLPKTGEVPQAGRRLVSPGYLRAMGIPLVQGRTFTLRDRPDSPGVVIVNRTLARSVWPGENPLGKRLSLEEPDQGEWLTVVGVVGDVRHLGVDEDPQPEIYRPFAQQPWFAVSVVVRAERDPLLYVDVVRREVQRIDPKLPLFDVQTLSAHLRESLAAYRFSFLALTILGVLGLLLAMTGVYAVMSYVVNDRAHDLAIHLAMGADKSNVMRLVVRQGMLLVTLGILLGVGLTILVRPVLSALLFEVLFGVESSDPVTFASVVVVVVAISLLANVVPARRAMKVDPSSALKAD